MSRRPAAAGLVCAAFLMLSAAPAYGASSARPSSSRLEEAQRALEALDYRGAQRALTDAEQTAGNPLETTLRILELQGIVAAALGDDAGALHHFERLLSLSPDWELQPGLSPRLTAPFEEARRASAGRPPLSFSAELTQSSGDARARVQVQADPLGLARGVRVRVQSPPPLRAFEAPLLEGRATVPLPPHTSQIEVELLGANGNAVARGQAGGAPGPLSARAVPVAEHRTLRPWAWAATAGAGASLAMGSVFGLRARDARAQLLTLPREGGQRISDLTQRQAFELNDRAVREARLANGLFVAGAALGAGAAVLFLLEPPTPSPGVSASLLAGPGGLAVTGTWP